MSGRKINDHQSWMGKGGAYPLPMGNKMKSESSAGGNEASGSLDYPDTSEMIKRDQEKNISKTKAHPIKPGFRH